jgi:hypothetical protein
MPMTMMVQMRNDVRHLLARLHAAMDDGQDVRPMRRRGESLMRGARRLTRDPRLGTGEREELAALLDSVDRLCALGSVAAAA